MYSRRISSNREAGRCRIVECSILETLAHLLQRLPATWIDALGLQPTSDNVASSTEIAQGEVDLGKIRLGDSIIGSEFNKATEVDFGLAELLGSQVAHGKVIVAVGVFGFQSVVFEKQGHGLGGSLFLHQLFAEVESWRRETWFKLAGFKPEAFRLHGVPFFHKNGSEGVTRLGVAGFSLDDFAEEPFGVLQILPEHVALRDGCHDVTLLS